MRRRTPLQASEPAGRTTAQGPTHETAVLANPTLRGEGVGEGAGEGAGEGVGEGAGEGVGEGGELSHEGLSSLLREANEDLETVMA